MKTFIPKEQEITRAWHLVDAAGRPAGRLAVEVANLLRGRGKPMYTPHVDTGDFVVVINAARVRFTGSKEEQKLYWRYTGFRGGRKTMTAAEVRAKRPQHIVEHAVKGMLPRNHLSRTMLKRLKVYAGSEHPHTAQKPVAAGKA